MLLIDFVSPPFGRVIDLGAGSGIIGLGLLSRDGDARLTAVETQPRLAMLARRNADENGFGERAEVREIDLRGLPRLGEAGGAYDLVVSNPPYRRSEEGPPSPTEEIAIAHHELRLTLASLARTIRWAIRQRTGRTAVVYPAARIAELLATFAGERLRATRVRFVHPKIDQPANRVLVEAVKAGNGTLVVEPPLVLRDANDQYTAEAMRILGG